MFFTWHQNNAFGYYTKDPHHIIVEADTLDEAREKVIKTVEHYDDECRGCCGRRWNDPQPDDGTDVPCIFGDGNPLKDYPRGNHTVHTHMKGGRVILNMIDTYYKTNERANVDVVSS